MLWSFWNNLGFIMEIDLNWAPFSKNKHSSISFNFQRTIQTAGFDPTFKKFVAVILHFL